MSIHIQITSDNLEEDPPPSVWRSIGIVLALVGTIAAVLYAASFSWFSIWSVLILFWGIAIIIGSAGITYVTKASYPTRPFLAGLYACLVSMSIIVVMYFTHYSWLVIFLLFAIVATQLA